MPFPVSSRALLPSLMASALLLAGATACSRSDRTETGSGNTGAGMQDTASAPADQTSGAGNPTTGTGTGSDTSMASDTPPAGGAAVGDTSSAGVPSNAPRAATAAESAEGRDASRQGDTTAAGYRPMERDTTNIPESDSARVTKDTSDTSRKTTDTVSTKTTDTVSTSGEDISSTDVAVTVDDTAMARDTSTTADQIYTTEVAVGAVTVGAADTPGDAGRIRPPEDSTELWGSVGDETADEQAVTTADSSTDTDTSSVGAAAIGGTVTGADAVASLTREGVRCTVVDPEENEEVRWDMSSTPVSLNPCGLGTMVLSKIWISRDER